VDYPRPMLPCPTASRACLLLLILLAPLAGCGREQGRARSAPEEVRAGVEVLARELRGAVAYQRQDGIYTTEIGTLEAVPLAAGGVRPRWSPDGERIAFVRGEEIALVPAGGGAVRVVARDRDALSVAWEPDGSALLFAAGERVQRVDLETGAVRTVLTGYRFFELDRSGERLVATVKGPAGFGWAVRLFDLESGESRRLARGCSASFSPDGALATSLRGDHERLDLREVATGRVVGGVDAPPGLRFDNQTWSSHPDWIASESEGEWSDVFLHEVSTGRAFQVTDTGDARRPHAFLRPAR
jgi:dipeptidyl aminopeptidase/acylaminoacyl peptidase